MEKTNTASGAITSYTINHLSTPNTGRGTGFSWNFAKLIQVNEIGETIEIIYSQTGVYTPSSLGLGGQSYSAKRVFKIVYSFVDGKINKSEPIYGKIIPAMDEYYTFED